MKRLWISLAVLSLLVYQKPSIVIYFLIALLGVGSIISLYRKFGSSRKESLLAVFCHVLLDAITLFCILMRYLNFVSDVESLRLPNYMTLLLKPHPDVSYETVQIKNDTITIIMYRPKVIRNNGAIIYAHGGGWVMFTARMFHSAVSWIAHECQMVVISVDYRRPPEHTFPQPLLDVYHTVLWTQLNAAKLGVDPELVILMGDSSGGNLAAGATNLHRDYLQQGKHAFPPIRAQVLIYPVLQAYSYLSPSYVGKDLTTLRKFVSYYVAGDLSLTDVAGDPGAVVGVPAYWSSVVEPSTEAESHESIPSLKVSRSLEDKGPDNLSNAYCFPLLETDTRGLPPTYMLALSRDAIRDDAAHYAAWLRAGGVEVEWVEETHATHGFMFLYGTDECALGHLRKIVEFVWTELGHDDREEED